MPGSFLSRTLCMYSTKQWIQVLCLEVGSWLRWSLAFWKPCELNLSYSKNLVLHKAASLISLSLSSGACLILPSCPHPEVFTRSTYLQFSDEIKVSWHLPYQPGLASVSQPTAAPVLPAPWCHAWLKSKGHQQTQRRRSASSHLQDKHREAGV